MIGIPLLLIVFCILIKVALLASFLALFNHFSFKAMESFNFLNGGIFSFPQKDQQQLFLLTNLKLFIKTWSISSSFIYSPLSDEESKLEDFLEESVKKLEESAKLLSLLVSQSIGFLICSKDPVLLLNTWSPIFYYLKVNKLKSNSTQIHPFKLIYLIIILLNSYLFHIIKNVKFAHIFFSPKIPFFMNWKH